MNFLSMTGPSIRLRGDHIIYQHAYTAKRNNPRAVKSGQLRKILSGRESYRDAVDFMNRNGLSFC